MWTTAFSCSLCMKLRSPGFRNSFSILATLNVCGRHLSRLPRKHHLLFSWKRNAWWQSRVSKRVDSVCLEYWLAFFRHSISIAWNWTFFQTWFPLKCWLYSHLWRLTGVIFRCHALEFQFALANQFMKADLEDYAHSKDRDYFDVCNVCLRPTPPALLRLSGPRGTILRCIVCDDICDTYEFL